MRGYIPTPLTAAIPFPGSRPPLILAFPAPWRSSGAISSSSSARCSKSFVGTASYDEGQVRARFHLAKRSRKGRRPWRGEASGAKRRFGYFRAFESSPPKAAPAAGGTAFHQVTMGAAHYRNRHLHGAVNDSDHPHPALSPLGRGENTAGTARPTSHFTRSILRESSHPDPCGKRACG
jgi:hypothetical protein